MNDSRTALTPRQLLNHIQSLADDPLGLVIIQEFRISGGYVRWNSDSVQVRRDSSDGYSFPEPAQEFIDRLKLLVSPSISILSKGEYNEALR